MATEKTFVTWREAPPAGLEPVMLRVEDAVRFTSLTRTRIFALMAEGKLRRIKIGKTTLIPVADLRALADAQVAA